MTSLYEADFYAWANQQAALLRAGKLSSADIAHIAEEIEVIAHPTPAIGSAGSLTASTKRMVSNTEARLAFAVLTTERKAA